jgi:putative tryptophan/tyrosine transport system substrate-binding protein
MRRRKFITLIGGAAAAWPLAARTQQAERVRRIGMLIPFSENDPETQARLAAFKQQLQKLGWAEGRNLRIDYRFAGDNIERIRIGAEELVAVAPDVIVVYANPAVAALRQATRVMPVVFAQVSDPVGSGFVTSLARPGGNITGFQNFETEIGGKWLEVLKQIAPAVRRVAVVHGPDIAVNVAFLHAAEAASTPLGITVTAAGVRSGDDIESTLAAFAREPNGGLIVAPSPINLTNRELIIASAAQLGLPAIYPYSYFTKIGGLASYGFDQIEQSRGAASYVDRILKGEKPADLPVQAPTKYELIINLKTARALGLTVPQALQASADEVIE